ncbi:HAD family hydrolase [Salipaludibacillus aurantiacus]|uniref:Cof subfamily of IIB subfamily of haloacid dehalogenase superfamily/HAD-superfamily hydrolase, subfamily IIB n=1 Tax=Salipaludibacillus aurantiacus TaxID=1601833 RepID=A0A1H9S8H9_9BACI|nr:HAD family hydrolase [Salipaludibacillus aurantiacus]SER80895.1 hypothetical protein SAMN05518684_10467 [Salipaludibacillus aurantiacus]
MNIKAMFIDMDGTLLTGANKITRRNAKAVSALMERNINVFLATGRQFEITQPYHRILGLNTPMVCLNGASVHDGVTGYAVQTKPVKLDRERLHHLTGDDPCNVLVHAPDGLYCKRVNAEIEEWTREGRVPPRYVGDLSKAGYKDALKYSIRTGAPGSSVSMLFEDEADVIDWDDGFEIVARGVSKWSAIQSVLEKYGIAPEETVTIGDGPNDIQMLSHAGIGVAMGNAAPAVKASADLVTSHHEQEGLADFIEHYLVSSYAL